MLGYYVDEGSGKVCSTATPPPGFHFEFKSNHGFQEVWIVSNSTGEVHQEVVFWPSLEALAAAGVTVDA